MTSTTPWYRTRLAYVLFFFFLTPVWTILILTEKRKATEMKMLSVMVFFVYMVFLPKLFTINQYPKGTYTVVYEVWCKDCNTVPGLWYLDAAGNQVTLAGPVSLPWTTSFRDTLGSSVEVETGKFTDANVCCSITINGEKISYNISLSQTHCFTRIVQH